MLSIQGTGRSKSIAFRKKSGEVIKKIPGLIAARKHVIDEKGWVGLRSTPHVFCFVSSPKIYRQEEVCRLSKGWCHALRDKAVLPDRVPEILLPESDFLDDNMVYFKRNKVKYDYFYFTINASPGINNKGLYEFLDILPVLHRHKLKGKVIVYFPNSGNTKRFTVKLNTHHKENLKKYSKYVDFHWGFLHKTQMNDVMTSCKFGLFPNTADNSPRIISESLIRDVPVLLNQKIHGGWHYINKDTGALFNRNNIEECIELMMSNNFHAKDYYEANYGFERSSKKLASFIRMLFGYDDVTHAYFSDFDKYLECIND